MEYDFREKEAAWQKYWKENQTFKAENNSHQPKYYVLDMFPYPSGAGLHVGHPLGYIASDIYARYKRLKGFNVLHPMGYDAFGLPAEQYAIQTGQHPAITTENNIKRYREQLDKIGFSFDWSREVRTSDPSYYKWTQWIFIQLFNSWYNNKSNKAEDIKTLISAFEKDGNTNIDAACEETKAFTAEAWRSMNEAEQQTILLNYRLTFLSETMVNWCPKLGTVLANEEVKDGLSERGGYPVERKLMKQWSMRITAYAERLLKDLNTIDWTDSLKESQRYWIGKSEGSSIEFEVQGHDAKIEVFTTRPDTIFGVSFVTLAPEHPLVKQISTAEQKEKVTAYVAYAANRSERERLSDVKKISGAFTGAYVKHPFTNKDIPIWIGDYVLGNYGTGAVMAVPGHDGRDFAFAKHFNLPILEVVKGPNRSVRPVRTGTAYEAKEGKLINSDFLNGLDVKAAIKKAIEEIEKRKLGKGQINYRLRDAIFSRQRYWGEPIPVYYKEGIPYVMEENKLPLELPEVDKYLPTEDGEPPLARAKNWKTAEGYPIETNTMPGWAGSSWYYLRYMDAKNEKGFVSKEAVNYWQNVDLYIGGAEHATGHLLYVRFWTKFLYDRGYLPFEEPAKKLINQGMIQGESQMIYYVDLDDSMIQYENGAMPLITKLETGNIEIDEHVKKIIDARQLLVPHTNYKKIYFSADLAKDKTGLKKTNVLIDFVKKNILDVSAFDNWIVSDSPDSYFYIDKSGYRFDTVYASFPEEANNEISFKTASEVEKMSKSKWNVVSPDDIVAQYGADTLRLYEMFLGPLELSKPWDTNGISGVSGFLKKLWRLYHDADNQFTVSEETPDKKELKVLHTVIKKAEADIERFSFNTSVSAFMICVNELTALKCKKRAILEPLAIVIAPYAPHIAEELWNLLGHQESISHATFPVWSEEFLTEDSFAYPVSFNGKMRFKMELPLSLTKEEIEKEVMSSEEVKKWLENKDPKKVIVVPNKIVNIVV